MVEQTFATRDLIVDPLDAFLHDYHEKTRLNRTILDHLLHFTFGDGAASDAPERTAIVRMVTSGTPIRISVIGCRAITTQRPSWPIS